MNASPKRGAIRDTKLKTSIHINASGTDGFGKNEILGASDRESKMILKPSPR